MKILHIALLSALLPAALLPAQARADKAKTVLDVKNEISDDNIVYPESYEVDTQKMLEGWYMQNYTATDNRYRTQRDVPVTDDQIRDRLSKLNTVIEMPFNSIVRSYIERYTSRGRENVAALLGLSNYYMPIFEQALEEEGLPLELKYLPVIESALNPNAVSKHGATGLWQFMLATGKGMGLEISSLVDERRDPYRSSEKAAKYLKTLHDTYNDWGLAIAAYNCGPGTLNKAIRRAGGDPAQHDFWSIYYFLPAETRGYVPMFIAANYVMNYYPYHNISPVLATKPLVTDTLMISDRVHFDQISTILSIPVDELRVLNPQFRADIIPGRPDRQYTLVLPSQQVHAYIMSEEDILAYNADKYRQRIDATPGEEPSAQIAAAIESEGIESESDFIPAAEEAVAEAVTAAATESDPKLLADNSRPARAADTVQATHKVKPGESLASIAELYAVTPEQIKEWNSLTRNSLRTGQMLRINTSRVLAEANGAKTSNAVAAPAPRHKELAQESASKKTAPAKEKKTAKDSKKKKKTEAAAPKSHTVKSGENLTTIAKKYGTTVEALKKANGLTGDALRAGDDLKLPSAAKAKGSKSKGTKSKGTKSKSKKKKRR